MAFLEDCFEDMERPRFGWRAKVTLMENEACEINFENPELSTCGTTGCGIQTVVHMLVECLHEVVLAKF